MTIKTQTNQYMTSCLNSRMKQKMMIIIHAVHAKIHFQNILRYFLDNIDTETMDIIWLFTNKNVKYLFHKFKNYLLFNGLNTVPSGTQKLQKLKLL